MPMSSPVVHRLFAAACLAVAGCAHGTPRTTASAAAAPLAPAPAVTARRDASSSSADEPLVTDRPDFTESAAVVPLGRTQLEAGETFGRESGSEYLSLGEALLRIGVAPRLELRVAGNSYGVTRDGSAIGTGFEDASVGVKYALTDEPRGWRPQLAVIGAVTLPTGTRTMSAQRTLPELKLLAAWDVTDRIGFATNANWAHAVRDGFAHDEWSASGSVSFAATDRLGLYAEAFAFREHMATWIRRDYVNGGLTVLLSNDLQLDLRAGRGPSPSRGDYFTGLGLSHRW